MPNVYKQKREKGAPARKAKRKKIAEEVKKKGILKYAKKKD
jgi:hypothetical protein